MLSSLAPDISAARRAFRKTWPFSSASSPSQTLHATAFVSNNYTLCCLCPACSCSSSTRPRIYARATHHTSTSIILPRTDLFLVSVVVVVLLWLQTMKERTTARQQNAGRGSMTRSYSVLVLSISSLIHGVLCPCYQVTSETSTADDRHRKNRTKSIGITRVDCSVAGGQPQ